MLLLGLLVAYPQACEGRRTISKGNAVSNLTALCPALPELNVKGDCVDKDASIVPAECCAVLGQCRSEISDLNELYEPRFNMYMSDCELRESDLAEEDGLFRVVDSTQICSPTCQKAADSVSPVPDADLQALKAKCQDTRAQEELHALGTMVTVLGALDSAWTACSATTVAPVNATMATTTTTTTPAPERYWTPCAKLPFGAKLWGLCRGDKQIGWDSCGLFNAFRKAHCEKPRADFWNGRCAPCKRAVVGTGAAVGAAAGLAGAILWTNPIGLGLGLATGLIASSHTDPHCPADYHAIEWRPCGVLGEIACEAKCSAKQ